MTTRDIYPEPDDGRIQALSPLREAQKRVLNKKKPDQEAYERIQKALAVGQSTLDSAPGPLNEVAKTVSGLGANPPAPNLGRGAPTLHQIAPNATSGMAYADDDPDLQWIIQRESSGNPTAYNPEPTSSGNAFGLGQLTDANRESYGGRLGFNPNTTNPQEQVAMMKEYIKERYGSPAAARAYWEQNQSY